MREIIWTKEEAAEATGGVAEGASSWQASSVSIDSRTVARGDLFIAIKGEYSDGHEYVAQALEKGAVVAVVSSRPDNIAEDASLLIVKDTTKALEDLARFARKRTRAKVVGVTGSVGKTSTKEMLKAALEAQGEVHASAGNLNNHYGVPLSLARLPEETDYAIFEMGMNHAGEIATLTKMVRPDVSLITTVEPVHLENFSSVEKIAEAKGEIFLGMEKGGAAILNKDNPHYKCLVKCSKSQGINKIISFGTGSDALYRLLACTPADEGSRITASCNNHTITYNLNLAGKHQALNSLAVLAAVYALGADIDMAARGFSSLMPQEGRGKEYVVKLPQGVCLLIDDSYNASPASITAALDVLVERKKVMGGRAVAVLGDMLELGDASKKLHKGLSAVIESAEIDAVITVGEAMEALQVAVGKDKRAGHFASSEAAAPAVAEYLASGDVLLVKGSRGLKMEKIVQFLLNYGKAATIPSEVVDAV